MISTLLAQPISENSQGVEAAVVAASAVAVLGAAASPAITMHKTRHLATRNLAANLGLSMTLRAAAVTAFIAGLVLIIIGDKATAAGIYATLSSAALATVSMLVDRNTNRAMEFSIESIKLEREEIKLSRIESLLHKSLSEIHDPKVADETRKSIALNATHSLTDTSPHLKGSKILDSGGSAPTPDKGDCQDTEEPGEEQIVNIRRGRPLGY